jgi:hypothetical protein
MVFMDELPIMNGEGIKRLLPRPGRPPVSTTETTHAQHPRTSSASDYPNH